jgi:hypothetical protein
LVLEKKLFSIVDGQILTSKVSLSTEAASQTKPTIIRLKAKSCSTCVFVTDKHPDYCFKTESIKQLAVTYSDNSKVYTFLTYKLKRHLRKNSCHENNIQGLEDVNKIASRNAYFDLLHYGCKQVEQKPWSEVRRKYTFSHRPCMVKVYCCWVTCRDETCRSRGRGRKCSKQSKLCNSKTTSNIIDSMEVACSAK